MGNKQRFYIAAQSPHEELTTRIFWQCVWEADVYLIVQLSEDLNYIPPNTNQRMEFGQVSSKKLKKKMIREIKRLIQFKKKCLIVLDFYRKF